MGSYDAKAGVLVFFMRATSCPVCTRHAKDLVERSAEFGAAGVQVVIAVPEGRTEAARWKSKHDISVPVVTGRRGSPHESVGLTRKVFGSMQQSGTILVDSHGRVRYSQASTLPTGSYDRKAVAAAIAELGRESIPR